VGETGEKLGGGSKEKGAEGEGGCGVDAGGFGGI